MPVLETETVRAALGQRLADRFLQYAQPVVDGEPHRLLVHIDEHLGHVRRAAARRPDSAGDVDTADRVAAGCKRLLMRVAGLPPDEQAAAVGAVRYFLDTHDLDRDDAAGGFEDDAQVLNYVLAAVASDLPLV